MTTAHLPCIDAAKTIRNRQQGDAKRVLERLQRVDTPDLTISYTLHKSAVVLPGVLVRFIALAVLFRLDSPKKWRLALSREILPETARQWLGIQDLTDLVEQANVDWIPPRLFVDTLSWHVTECLTQCAMPRPSVVIRQTIRDLLLRGAKPSQGGLVLDRRFWRAFVAKSQRPCSTEVAEECLQRVEFVLGQADLAEEVERRWLDIPKLNEEERTKLEAVQVAKPCERLQALQEAFDAGHFDFVTKLLACSYSRCGRRAHHPLLLWRIWMAMLAVESPKPGTFLESVDDSLQLRLFLKVMSHEQLPSERRIKGFASERMAPVIEYLVLWHQFMLLRDDRIQITAEFGTDSADMHGQARMKSDASAKFITPLLGWLIDECRRFCEQTGRSGLSQVDQEVLIEAFRQLDWKALGNFGRNRHLLLAAIRDTLNGQLVTPLRSRVRLDSSPRDGPVSGDIATFAEDLAAEFLERMKVFGESFNGATYYDPECSPHTKRSKTVHGYGVQFLADLKYGLIWSFAVYPAGEGFRPAIADWVSRAKQTFGWESMVLTSDREYTIAKAIHQWHEEDVLHYGPRSDVDRPKKDIFLEKDFDIHDGYAVCPNGKQLKRKPHVFVRGSSEQWRYQAKGTDCRECPIRSRCTTSSKARMLCVNVYREDLTIHAERMKADPERTRDLMGRHRAMSEGIVNNLMNHQGVRHAKWKGLALARVQVGLAIVMINTIKWHKIMHGQLEPMALKPAA